jgi:hypothetical protein
MSKIKAYTPDKAKEFLEEVKSRMLDALDRAEKEKYLLEQNRKDEVLKKVTDFVRKEGFELKGRKFYDIYFFKKEGNIWGMYNLVFWKEQGKPQLRLDNASVIDEVDFDAMKEVIEKNGFIAKKLSGDEEIWAREVRW